MKPARGFSLIELAIVLFVGTIILSAGLRVLNAHVENAAYSTTRIRQEAIKDALIAYLGKNNRLPCPDTKAVPDGNESRILSITPSVCAKFFGVLPYATLGISRELALDGWENFISYGVSPKWTLTYNPAPVAAMPQTSVATDAFNVGYSGVLTVNDRVPATSAAVTPITTAAVVVLISYGKNGLGAITVKGSQNVLPAASTDELVNVNVGGTGTAYFKREYTDTAVPTYGAFDDVVRVLQSTELVSPLTKDGSLTSASALLGQSFSMLNDAIFGSAVASHIAPGPYTIPSAIPDVIDPWGNKITIDVTTSSISQTTPAGIAYTLTSNGPDGIKGSADDIISTVRVERLQGIFSKFGYS
jgi:prepilin-type N-terminal cleavage/methylation domain-containing protein